MHAFSLLELVPATHFLPVFTAVARRGRETTIERRPQKPSMSSRFVIGLTGPNGAGKGEVAALLQEGGYSYISLSDMVRQEAASRGLEPIRDNLIRVGREMRRNGGPGVLAERASLQIEPPCVVDSIRNPGEVAVLRSIPGFYLLGITALPEVRLERLRSRARPGDPQTMEDFLEKERIEDSSDEEGQQASATLALADLVVSNDGTLDALAAKVRAALADLETLAARSTTARTGQQESSDP